MLLNNRKIKKGDKTYYNEEFEFMEKKNREDNG